MGDTVDRVIYFVVGDSKLNSGNGIHVKDLEDLKASLMKKKIENDWQLVISIHGAEDVIATEGGFLKNRQAAGAYEADDIKALFSDDEAFKKWREKYGPAWTTLNACQVHKPFEAVILSAFNKPRSTQNAQGLGAGCRPLTEVQQYFRAGSKTPVTTRAHWSKLSRKEQAEMIQILAELNEKFGYFGGPPVDKSLLLDYYFDEEPKGGWPVVTVSHNRADTGFSFYNRTQNAQFLSEKCTEHRGPMRGHKAAVPPAP